MTRFLCTVIGVVWGYIIGAVVMHFVSKLFGNSTLICGIVYGIPILVGLLSGIASDDWTNIFAVLGYPLLSLLIVAVLLIIIFLAALVMISRWNLLWIVPLVIALITPAKEFIVMIIEK